MNVTSAFAALRSALIYGPEYSFLAFFQILIQLLRPDIVDKENKVQIISTHDIAKVYDFIIIGGGSAGSVLANRLIQDHVTAIGYDYLTDLPWEDQILNNADSERSSKATTSAVEQFFNSDDGPLFDTSGRVAAAYVNTKYADSTLDFPDVRLGLRVSTDNSGGLFSKQYRGKRNDFMATLYKDISENLTYTIAPSLLRPKSKGYIKLRDANTNHHPVIVPNYFGDLRDLDALVKAARIAYNISQMPTMKKINARSNFNFNPECADFIFLSDDYLRCHSRYNTATGYHPCCTCKMGPVNDPLAVVDSRLRMYGVKALRVVDASVMPNIVSGNINAPTIMIAEKAADLIEEDYHSRRIKRPVQNANLTCINKLSPKGR